MLSVLLTLCGYDDKIIMGKFVIILNIDIGRYMEYLFSLLLLGLNLFDYEININRILFFIVSLVLVVGLFYVVFCKCKDFMCTCMVLMAHTWPISWRNIFGDATANLQITWFYLLGALIVLYWIFNINKFKTNKVNAVILGIYSTLCIIAIYPLIISPSIKEGAKEFFVIYFFIILTLVAFFNNSTMSEKNRKYVIDAYIWSAVISSVLLIFQTVLYLTFGESVFKYSVGNYFGNRMISVSLLMEDTSCSTIMLGCGIFYMLERFNKNEKRFLYAVLIVITVIGLALTTRRTSVISLIVCFVLYVPIYYKGVAKKLTMFAFLAVIVIVMMSYLLISRPVDSYSQYLYNNGRFESYINSLGIFLSHPLGVGYDNVNLVNLVGNYVPHNTIIRWLNMGGIFFTLLMMIILLYVLKIAYKKGRMDDMWVMIYCLLAMNFIPDLLNARFFVLPCMLIFLSASQKEEKKMLLPKELQKNKRIKGI